MGTEEEFRQELLLERYKFVLSQMKSLDENVNRLTLLFQGVVAAVFGVTLAFRLVDPGIQIENALVQSVLAAAAWIVLVVAALCFLSIVAGMFSWMDYRREESALLQKANASFRQDPTWRNVWRWSETYLAVLVLVGGIAVWRMLLSMSSV